MARQITIDIIGDAKNFTHATEEASKAAGGFGHTMANVASIGAGALLSLGTAAIGFGIHAVEHMVNAGQAAYEMSEKFGILPKQASQWMSVASQLGISSEVIGAGFGKFDKAVGNLAISLDATGHIAKTALEPFKVLGLNVFDLHHHLKDANELMLETADIFAKMPGGAEKTALAIKLFGKAGAEMIPVLNQGRAGIEGMIAKGTQLGDVMSGPQVEAAHKMHLAQAQLKTMLDGVTIQIGEKLLPILVTTFTWIQSTAVPWVQNAIKVMGTWHDLWRGLANVVAVMSAIFRFEFSVAMAILKVEIPIAVAWARALYTVFTDIVTVIQDVIASFGMLAGMVTNSPAFKLLGGLGSVAHTLHVPGFAAGTDYVPQTMLAVVHQGERIIPAGRSGGMVVHNHFEGAFILDGPTIDRLTTMILQRARFAPGL